MRIALLFILCCATSHILAQQGYVINEADSTFSGYVRSYRSPVDGEEGIEVWKTKNDKNPRKFPRESIVEYAIKKDTFRVFHQYRPFPDKELFFEIMEARVLMHGKVNLYEITYSQKSTSVYVTMGIIGGALGGAIGGGVVSGSRPVKAYVLEHKKTGFLEALPRTKDKLEESLKNFFPEGYVSKYAEVKNKGKITYEHVPDMVRLYNSR